MSPKDIFLHLRFPFSFFLMPIYWLALSQQQAGYTFVNILIFIVLHICIYPASNAYNSYFDKDEGSIGGLENPPKVDRKLWKAANYFDAAGILIAFFMVDRFFGLGVLFYVAVSRMYSYTGVRLKKYAVISWLIVGLFQGALVFFLVFTFGQKLNPIEFLEATTQAGEPAYLGAIMSAFILWAVYPLTQVYQHEADAKSGDRTISMLLGVKGTFVFSMIFFAFAFVVAYLFLPAFEFYRFVGFSLPVAGFLNIWFVKVLKDQSKADFKHTMQLNVLSSVMLNICFLLNILW